MSDEITVTITRDKAYVMSKTSVNIIIDNAEVGKLKNGESMEFRTTAGSHQFEAKAVSALAGLENFDLQDGDHIHVKMKLVGWDIRLERK